MESPRTDMLATLAENLRCSICFDIFKDPATSSCGKHNYCLNCLKRHCEGKADARKCPDCRKEFHKGYEPQRNLNLCEIVSISRPYLEDNLNDEDLSSSAKKPEVADESEHNLQTLKRKLTHLTSEIKKLDDILSKKCKTKEQSTDVAPASNESIENDRKNTPRYIPCEFPDERLDSMTNSLRLGLECLSTALCLLEPLDVPSQDVDLGQNMGESLQDNQLPAEPSTVAWQQQDAEQTPEQPVTPLQLEGGPSEAHSEDLAVSMELETEVEEAGPSAGLDDCLEHLSFSPQLAHKYLTFSDDNRRVQVRRRSLGRPSSSCADRFNNCQVMADQEFGSGVHYWEVDTSQSVGWALGVAYSGLGREEKLGRNPSSWCLEWSSHKLCFWHNDRSEHIKYECPSEVRIMLDMDDGCLAFSSTTDNLILLHSVEVQFTSPVRPAFWLYGLKPGNSLALVVP